MEQEDEAALSFIERVDRRWQAANELAGRTRKDFAIWLNSSIWGLGFDLMNCFFSLVSVAFYVVGTYYSSWHGAVSKEAALLVDQLDQVELWLTFFFLFDYLLYLYAADQRFKHMCKLLNVIDFVTIVPSLLTFIIESVLEASNSDMNINEMGAEIATSLNFLRAVRVLKLLRLLRLMRAVDHAASNGATSVNEIFKQTAGMVLTGLSLFFCFAGLFQVIETTSHTKEELLSIWTSQDNFYFHDALYFTIITISTVGYGDMYPTTGLGKLCTAFTILGSLAVFTDQVNKLVELLSLTSPYARASYTARRHPHVMMCGSISYSTVHDFLEEFFHPDHGNQDTKVCLV